MFVKKKHFFYFINLVLLFLPIVYSEKERGREQHREGGEVRGSGGDEEVNESEK